MRKSGELRVGKERADAREDVRLFFYIKKWRADGEAQGGGRLAGEESGSAFLFQGDWHKERGREKAHWDRRFLTVACKAPQRCFMLPCFYGRTEKGGGFSFFRDLNENDAREIVRAGSKWDSRLYQSRGQRMDEI